jgi:hypothetical protein
LTRILITGSRDWNDTRAVEETLTDLFHTCAQSTPGAPFVVVHGAAPGADTIADRWAYQNASLGVTVERHRANWNLCAESCPPEPRHRRRRRNGTTYCPAAGPRRNAHMVSLGATLCIAFPLGASEGTRGCMRLAEAAGIPVLQCAP